MVMGACPGQIPISCVLTLMLTLMVTATMVRACRYRTLYPVMYVEPVTLSVFEKAIAIVSVSNGKHRLKITPPDIFYEGFSLYFFLKNQYEPA